MLSLENIARAASEIDPVFRGSPQFEAEPLRSAVGARVLVKVETINPIRNFKGRGTDFFVRQLERGVERLICASAGNFGQGLAYAARARSLRCEVFAGAAANELKLERMRALGATVHVGGRDFDEAKDRARDYAERENALYVVDGRELAIAEGAGTIGMELCAWREPIAAAVVPLGNGALLGGVATWLKHAAPSTRVIGVCAAGAPAMERSMHAGRLVQTPSADTIADGIAVRVPVPEALDYLRNVVDDVLLVSEEALRKAVRVLWDTLGVLVEPAGAAGVAAMLEHRAAMPTGLLATPLCGGNLTPNQLSDLLAL